MIDARQVVPICSFATRTGCSRHPSTSRSGVLLWSLGQTSHPARLRSVAVSVRHIHNAQERAPYWQHIGLWKDVSEADFLSYRWQAGLYVAPNTKMLTRDFCQVANTIDRKEKLLGFLASVLPDHLPIPSREACSKVNATTSRDVFLQDVQAGMQAAPMAVRLTPHVLARVDWSAPMDDPISRQFLPLRSMLRPNHPALSLDSLHEANDSPVPGLVHRYPDKVLFLGTLNSSSQ